jgi:ATP-dependent Clp protease ATP-binding subunit ClpB
LIQALTNSIANDTAMNNVKFTSKCESLIATAAETAQESQHQQLTPIHLAIAIFEDPEGIAKQATIKV